MVEVKNLTKVYGDIKAVDNISFTVNDGEVLGFLGPNGAGKSTTMNIITGYLSSSSGTVTVDGSEILENPKETKMKIGYLPEIPPLYPDMTVKAYLEFMYDIKKVKLPKEEHLKEVMAIVKILEVKDHLIKNLSKGYKQRVGFAQALLGNPPVLILDEPTVGLDPKQIIEIRNLIAKLGKNHTIILSSHILSEIQSICKRVIIINRGEIIADDISENLSSKLSGSLSLVARIVCSENEMLEALETVKGVKSVVSLGSRENGSFDFVIEPEDNEDIRAAVFERVASRGKTLLSFTSNSASLEQVFLKLTEVADNNEARLMLGIKTEETIEEEEN